MLVASLCLLVASLCRLVVEPWLPIGSPCTSSWLSSPAMPEPTRLAVFPVSGAFLLVCCGEVGPKKGLAGRDRPEILLIVERFCSFGGEGEEGKGEGRPARGG